MINMQKSKRNHYSNKTCRNIALSGQLLLLILFICLLIDISAPRAHAQSIALSTYPNTIQLRTQEQSETSGGFTIENKSDLPIKLKIALKPFKPDTTTNDGKVIYLEGDAPSIFKHVKILDNESAVTAIELGPRQSKQLTIQITTDKTLPNSDHYFSIIFLHEAKELPKEVQNEASAQTVIQGGIAINVLLQVGPKELPHGLLEEFSTLPYRTSGPVPFTVKVKNNGNHFITPKGIILIKNIFGQIVGRIDLQNSNIIAGTSRLMTGTPHAENANKNSTFSTEKTIWPEKFLLGLYTAELSLSLSDEGPIIYQSLRFFALPVHILFIMVFLAWIIIMIIIRIRRKIATV